MKNLLKLIILSIMEIGKYQLKSQMLEMMTNEQYTQFKLGYFWESNIFLQINMSKKAKSMTLETI